MYTALDNLLFYMTKNYIYPNCICNACTIPDKNLFFIQMHENWYHIVLNIGSLVKIDCNITEQTICLFFNKTDEAIIY